jgi:hypothetical protein
MRRLRFLIAIPAIAGLAIMGATGASAAPVHQAAHARTMTAASSGADPLEFVNGNGLWIEGGPHGSDLKGTTDPDDATAYHYYPQSAAPGYYAYAPTNGLCWNTLAAAGDEIGIDSCPANDTNEWFTSPDDNYEMIAVYNDPSNCVWGAGNGKTLVIEPCSSTNERDLWVQYSPS